MCTQRSNPTNAAHVQVLVVVNKVDRPAARPDWVMDTTFDLFCDLGATDEQCDFPIVFASGLAGKVRLLLCAAADVCAACSHRCVLCVLCVPGRRRHGISTCCRNAPPRCECDCVEINFTHA